MIVQALQCLSEAIILQGKPPASGISGVNIDSRLIKPGELFIALPTRHRDGHDFISSALANGTSTLLVSKPLHELPAISENIWVVQVPDTYLALRELGVWFRKNVLTVPMIAITGSYAKTTVKMLITAILKELGEGLATSGNFNNLLGVPLTLMAAKPEHRYGLFEFGMNRYGEIAELTRIGNPDFGLITHIGRAHLEYFGSEWGVAQAKGELFANMKPDAVRIVNLDDPFIRELAERYPGTNDIGYTLKSDTHAFHGLIIPAKPVAADEELRFGIRIEDTILRSPLPGRHHCENLVAAAAAGIAMNLPLDRIAARIATSSELPMRGQILTVGSIRLIRDEYNASLHAMAAALDLLCDLPGARRRIAVLGDMFELGKWARIDHEMLADFILQKKLNAVFLIGEMCRHTYDKLLEEGSRNVFHFEDIHALIKQICSEIMTDDVILIKGSRGMALERVSEALIAMVHEKGTR